jgi:16S rRNA (adenine1518-N6/adenine1519-N6)-dimethyltransferase
MKLTEMKELLERHKIQLTKSLGQNFLHDSNLLEKISAAGELTAADQVLEIGPGLGPLTERLIQSGAHILAVELDERLVEILRDRFGAAENLELLCGDGMKVVKEREDWGAWKMVANLPYSMASAILVEAALKPVCFQKMVVTLQWEVLNRIAASAGTADYGLLTLLLQLRYKVTQRFKIRSGSFFPPPEIDSGVIVLERRAEEVLPVELHSLFVQIVKQGFSQRRKMMKKLLKMKWESEHLDEAFRRVNLPEEIRAEKVTLKQFAILTKLLHDLQTERSK